MSGQEIVYHDTDYCNMEKLIETEKKALEKDLYRDRDFKVATLKKEVTVMTRLCMSRR